MGKRSWAPPEEVRSELVVYDTKDDEQPISIRHDRDEIWDGGDIVQSYSFIDYLFGDSANPIPARYYLGDQEVMVDIPSDRPLSLDQARAAFPPEVLCYLQKRYERIDVLVEDGYQSVWSRRR